MADRTFGFIHAPEKNRRHPSVHEPKSWTWFVDWLGLNEPSDRKDCGWYVLGTFRRTTVRHSGATEDCSRLHRNKAGVESRSVVAIDADTAKPTFVKDVRGVLGDCAAVFYTTWSHTPEDPRWRLLLPLSRDVTPDEYGVLVKVLAAAIGSDQIDKGSAEAWRMMHRPSAPQGSDGSPTNGYASHVFDGSLLDADEWLAGAELLGITDEPEDAGEATDLPDADPAAEVTEQEREKAESTLAKAVRCAPDLTRPDGTTAPGRNEWVKDWATPLLSMVKGGSLDRQHVEDSLYDATLLAPGDETWNRQEFDGVCESVWGYVRATRPKDANPEDVFGAYGDDAAPVAAGDAAVVPATGYAFRIAEAHHPGSAMPNARLLLRRCPAVRWWRGGWYVYRDGVYVAVSTEWVRTVIYHAFEDAYYITGRGTDNERFVPWSPAPASVNATLDALGAVSMIEDSTEPDASRINLTNGLLDYRTRERSPHSEDVFSIVQLPFAYDAAATCPQWLVFLKDVFEGDPETIALAQEFFGYIVSGRTDLQKIFYLFGPRRAGKGVLLRVLTRLVGEANVASPTVSSYAKDFGLASLIGKTLATTADARFGKSTDIQTVTERWLTISGEDSISVPRKFRDDWVGTLGARIVVASNETPPFRDSSAAVVSRLVLLRFRKSYLGHEDTELTDRLLGELPGILNWALDGLDRLNKRGRFTVPAASLELAREMEEEASPIAAFVAETCAVGPEQAVPCTEFADRLNWWLAERGSNSMTSTAVGMAVRSAFPAVERKRRGPKGAQEWNYIGLGWQ